MLVDVTGPPHPPAALEGALQSLYGSYVKAFDAWEASDAAARGETPPVFIVVCNNTTVSKVVFDWVAGWERTGDSAALVPGRARPVLQRRRRRVDAAPADDPGRLGTARVGRVHVIGLQGHRQNRDRRVQGGVPPAVPGALGGRRH
ncbi:MAG: hypothetical protein ACRDWI_16165 [Jiangellaceae bacterium]